MMILGQKVFYPFNHNNKLTNILNNKYNELTKKKKLRFDISKSELLLVSLRLFLKQILMCYIIGF